MKSDLGQVILTCCLHWTNWVKTFLTIPGLVVAQLVVIVVVYCIGSLYWSSSNVQQWTISDQARFPNPIASKSKWVGDPVYLRPGFAEVGYHCLEAKSSNSLLVAGHLLLSFEHSSLSWQPACRALASQRLCRSHREQSSEGIWEGWDCFEVVVKDDFHICHT